MTTDDRATQSNNLSSFMLKCVTGYFDLECFRVLDLSDRRIESIDLLKKCTNLEILVLRNNSIRRLEPLSELLQLKLLDASNNMVPSIECLKSLENIEELNIAGNFIANLESIAFLGSLNKLKNLRVVDRLRGHSNPLRDKFSTDNEYRAQVLCLIPRIIMLDGLLTTAIGSEIMASHSKIAATLGRANLNDSDERRVDNWWPLEAALDSNPNTTRLHLAEGELKDLLADFEMFNQVVRHRNELGDRVPSRMPDVGQQLAP